ncbi:MAG: DUF3576 domain-containing protein [Nitrospirales bacterium]|nr:DUF3576 domain-containing protein [Nitrospirales bacterium]
MLTLSFASLLRGISILACTNFIFGCSFLSGQDLIVDRYMACPIDSVWNSSLETLKAYPVTKKDKSNGVIETGWRVEYVEGAKYGLFQREGMGDKERSQLTLTMKPLDSNAVRLQIAERRQHWGFRGGARLYDWYPVEPSQKAVDHILSNLTKKLEAEGCFIES